MFLLAIGSELQHLLRALVFTPAGDSMQIEAVTLRKLKMRLKAPFVSASKRYWEEDIGPPVGVSLAGTIPVLTSPGLGYHVRRDLVERWTTEKETWRAR
jgi:hypothetical protein